jgi:DNA-binding response OmpR family regulator
MHREIFFLKTQVEKEKNKAAQIASAEQLKIHAVSSMLSELYSPLTLILEPARHLLQNNRDKTAFIALQNIEKNSQRLFEMTNQLQDLLKMEYNLLKPDLRKANLLDTIRPVYQSFFVAADLKSLTLAFKPEADIPPFYFDTKIVDKIVSILLSESIVQTPPKGKIEVSIVKKIPSGNEEGAVPYIIMIQIKHTTKKTEGQNMEEKASQQWIDNTSMLTLARLYASAHGGTIWVDNGIHGENSMMVCLPFHLNMPQKDREGMAMRENALDNTNEAPAHVEETIPAASNYSVLDMVLIVENDVMMRQFIREILTSKKYLVVEASNAEDGMDKAEKLIPNLIITDLVMVGKDGNDLIAALKKQESTRDIPVIVLTAKTAMEHKLLSLKTGADVYLTKPFYTEELLVYVEKLLKKTESFNHKPPFKQTSFSETLEKEPKQPDTDFLQTLTLIIEQNLDNETLGVQELAEMLSVNRNWLYRKVKNLTGQNVLDFIRNYRLDRARYLLLNQEGNVNNIAKKTGFSNAKHFSRVFKERFGVSPGAIKQHTDT